VTQLSAVRQEWIEKEILAVLSRRWKATRTIELAVRRRFEWATDREIWSAIDRLWEADRIESKAVVSADGVHGNQWRLIA